MTSPPDGASQNSKMRCPNCGKSLRRVLEENIAAVLFVRCSCCHAASIVSSNKELELFAKPAASIAPSNRELGLLAKLPKLL